MPNTPHSLIDYIRTVVGAWRDDPRSDAELISRFAADGDENAFKALVCRHGPMVWRTCRHILGDTPDAEDAYQAALLALARKATRFTIKNPAGWLHRVARQAALDADASARRRKGLKQRLQQTVTQPADQKDDASQTELYAVLDEELASLPERLRVPLILRYLEGKTLAEVAQITGCSVTAVTKRLARGESNLRTRLTRRGLEAGAISALLTSSASTSTPPADLIGSTARAAVAFRNGTLSGASAEAAEKLLRSVSMRGAIKGWWVVLAGVYTLGVGGVGLMAWQMFGVRSDVIPQAISVTPAKNTIKTSPKGDNKRIDNYGDPLPEGALARIGTLRFRHLKGMGAVFLPDNRTLVTCENEEGILFWEIMTGRKIGQLKGPSKCDQIAVSADGNKLVAGNQCGEMWVWDLHVNPPRKLWRWKEDISSMNELAFTPDCKILAVVTDRNPDNVSILWCFDADTGKVRHKVEDFDRCFDRDGFVFSPNGKALATKKGLWDTTTWRKRQILSGGRIDSVNPSVYGITFSHDSKNLAVITGVKEKRNYSLSLLDVETGDESRRVISKVDTALLDNGAISCFLPDKRSILVAQFGQIHFLDSATGKPSSTSITAESNAHCNTFGTAGGAILSPNCKFIAHWEGKVIQIWDVATGRLVGPIGGIHYPVSDLSFSPDSKMLATLGGVNEPQFWEADTGRPGRQLEELSCGGCYSRSIDYSSDGNRITAIKNVYHPGNLMEFQFVNWDVQTGKISKRQPLLRDADSNYATSCDGRWQLWESNKKLIVLDHSTGREIHRFQSKGETFFAPPIEVSTDGQMVSAFLHQKDESMSSELMVLSVKNGRQQMSFDAGKIQLNELSGKQKPIALSPNGKWIAIATKRKEDAESDGYTEDSAIVRLLEVATGTEGAKFEASEAAVRCVAWSPNGRLLAAGDETGVVWLWDTITRREISHFTGHKQEVTALAFSPNGLRLASGSADTTVLVWDLRELLHQETRVTPIPSSDELWSALWKMDAAEARPVMDLLVQHPDVAIPLLRERLQPTPESDAKRVAKLLVQLNDNNFRVRNQAEKQLEEMSEGVKPALQKALENKPSLEVYNRINKVLTKIDGPPVGLSGMSTRQLHICRGVEVLERIGTPKARQLLEELSRLPAGTTRAEEAKDALQRLTKPTLIPEQ